MNVRSWLSTFNFQISQVLLENITVDINQGGDLGSTPIHYAAAKDYEECAKLLV